MALIDLSPLRFTSTLRALGLQLCDLYVFHLILAYSSCGLRHAGI